MFSRFEYFYIIVIIIIILPTKQRLDRPYFDEYFFPLNQTLYLLSFRCIAITAKWNSQLHTAWYKKGVFLHLEYLVDEWFKKVIIEKDKWMANRDLFSIKFFFHCLLSKVRIEKHPTVRCPSFFTIYLYIYYIHISSKSWFKFAVHPWWFWTNEKWMNCQQITEYCILDLLSDHQCRRGRRKKMGPKINPCGTPAARFDVILRQKERIHIKLWYQMTFTVSSFLNLLFTSH